jgi:hypothetical protein
LQLNREAYEDVLNQTILYGISAVDFVLEVKYVAVSQHSLIAEISYVHCMEK